MKHVVIQQGISGPHGKTSAPPPQAHSTEELADALRSRIQGEVRFDEGSRALYSTDASNYRQVPIGVVIPKDVDDVIATVALCHEYRVPVLARGGGTSLAGQTCNVAVVIDMSKYMNRVLEVDPQRKLARVQPGVILDDLRHQAEQYQLTFGPDPATHRYCTLGGMIGNNSCGTHSVMAGKTDDNIEEMEILTYDGLRMRVGRTSEEELEQIIAEGGRRGEIYARLKALRDKYADAIRARFPHIPRRVSGYALDQLLPENGFHVARALVGTENTCVTVLEATARLVNSPPARVLLALGYPDIYQATDHITQIIAHHPIALEGMDGRMIQDMHRKHLLSRDVALLPPAGGWLLVEFGRDTIEEARGQAQQLMEDLKKTHAPQMKLFDDPKEAARIWLVREAALGATGQVPGEKDAWPGWEDSAVPPDKVGSYLRDLRDLLERYGYRWAFYGHFGQGCIHMRVSFDLETSAGIKQFRSFMNQAADLVVKYGGSLSGEHGDGQARAELLPKMYGDELVEAFREFKAIWDPDGKMNPGKVVQPNRMDQDLRLGTDYRPPQPKTHFSFIEDRGSFSQATLRCIGVGKCRGLDGGTMCPSFMVTREEADTTRGRARLLFEMLQGNPLEGGWRSQAVKDALDLCFACKGCKGECPVNVDMATYKAEFLSHYYQGHLRPITAYAMGLIHWWVRPASLLPGVVNFFTQTPVLRDIAKALAGIAPQRQIPAFAPQTFRHWFHQRGPRNVGGPKVILWPDTFNDHFYPQTAIAAVEVLEAAGYQIEVPSQAVCCGRPLYDYGMLNLAKHVLQQVLVTLREQIADGIPIVVLEPSCAAVFRDELVNLFPHDEDAKRLSKQTFLLSEFLLKEGWEPPQQEGAQNKPLQQQTALVHGHCHHKAIMGMSAEEAVLEKLGLHFKVLDSGCCGMAGAFGFEKQHYDVSIKAGERVLLPAVRQASGETLIIANGFSCREQIAQTTDRRALHLAEVLQMALHKQQDTLADERRKVAAAYNGSRQAEAWAKKLSSWPALVGVLAIGGALIWILRKSRRQYEEG
ncbi:MAG TPA: FAD-binding and (Fe-S)-binding domain-containing protein [Ktedonobacteraceae bacterium]|nr:FAD-binding and (Fe-S)-binding domain-containing protein [Ktedonobacteraceae bacterium]